MCSGSGSGAASGTGAASGGTTAAGAAFAAASGSLASRLAKSPMLIGRSLGSFERHWAIVRSQFLKSSKPSLLSLWRSSPTPGGFSEEILFSTSTPSNGRLPVSNWNNVAPIA